MTTPTEGSDPEVPVPPSPEPTPEEAAAQQAAAEKAAAEAALNDQIKALATEIAKQTILAYDPLTRRKGTVSSLQTGTAPPTITVTISGDTTVEIPGVRYYEHYQPQVGDVVHIDKQATDIVAIGKIAEQVSETAFTTLTLTGDFTHNGNGNGNLMIRRIWDNGVWKVEMQGGINKVGGGATIVTGLDTKYRPTTATRRTVICARNAVGSNNVKVDINNDGTITLVGSTTGNHEHVVNIDDGAHTHSVNIDDNGHDHTIPTSTHNHGNHEHVIPTTVHTHSGAHPAPADSPHSHSGTTNVITPNDSNHTHGGTDLTAVTIDGTTGGTGVTIDGTTDFWNGVEDPLWISFNQVEYFL